MLANAKCDNEMIPGTIHRYPGIFITAEKTPSVKRSTTKVVSVNASNGIPYLQMRSVEPHSTSGREKEETPLHMEPWAVA